MKFIVKPTQSINAVAAKAKPGDTIIVRAGIYRERVNPHCDGLTYEADGKVFLRGSEVFKPKWKKTGNVWSGSLKGVAFGTKAYRGVCDELNADFNPYRLNFNRNKIARPHRAVVADLRRQLAEAKHQMETSAAADQMFSRAMKRRGDIETELKSGRYRTTLGQVFADGVPLREVEAGIEELPGTWMVSPDGESLLVHFPDGVCPVEISVRHAVFSPLKRRLGHITVRGFVIEHAANHFPCWGATGWAQAGMLSTRSGHHWVIEDNVIRYAKGLGVDCGSEGGREKMENRGEPVPDKPHDMNDWSKAGHHIIRNNDISDNGHCGLAGLGHVGTKVIGNRIERNNRDGWTSPWWEFGGVKFHFFFDGLIEGNLIRDNDAHGIWIDNQWRGSRITRNVIVNNCWSGINVELGRGPVMIDHNVIAHTRQGDGVYGHDVADVTIAHNLIYANANFGVWFAYATPRVKPEDGCWDIKTLNNIIAGNRAGAIGYPLPWQCAGNNTSDGNLFVGAGEYLDEGSGSRPPLFQITNATHMANMPEHHKFPLEAQSAEHVAKKFADALGAPAPANWSPWYYCTFEQWRKATGNDAHSRAMTSIRDSLGVRTLLFNLACREELFQVTCQKVPGLPVEQLPGLFQNMKVGPNCIVLWPAAANRSFLRPPL
jgi:hypothetical protein